MALQASFGLRARCPSSAPEWRWSPAAAGHWYRAAQRPRRNHLRPKLGVLQRPAKFRSFQCEDRQPQAPWALWPDQNKLPTDLYPAIKRSAEKRKRGLGYVL